MKTMKKFWKYFILFILLFLFVSGMTYIGTSSLANKNVKDGYEGNNSTISAIEIDKNTFLGTFLTFLIFS